MIYLFSFWPPRCTHKCGTLETPPKPSIVPFSTSNYKTLSLLSRVRYHSPTSGKFCLPIFVHADGYVFSGVYISLVANMGAEVEIGQVHLNVQMMVATACLFHDWSPLSMGAFCALPCLLVVFCFLCHCQLPATTAHATQHSCFDN